jgi:hypothetical protein
MIGFPSYIQLVVHEGTIKTTPRATPLFGTENTAVQNLGTIGLNGKFVPFFGQIKRQTSLCRYNFIHQCMHHLFR